jgi:hypothetical protein
MVEVMVGVVVKVRVVKVERKAAAPAAAGHAWVKLGSLQAQVLSIVCKHELG